jgi:phosphohistidine phosphatase
VRLYLVHHAEALGSDLDPQQPLSAFGRHQAASLASRAHALGARPALIWHSGKLRARQTAEAMLAACNPFATLRMTKGLRPEDRPDLIVVAIEDVDDDLMIVSHAPLLLLLTDRLGIPTAVPLNGMIAMSRIAPGRYVEEWRAEPKND